jgi:hypothetical protein
MRVRDTARENDEPAGAEMKLLLAALDDVLGLQHVEHLVFVRVDVEWRVEQRRALLEDGERPARRRSGGSDEDSDVAEHEALALVRIKRVAAIPVLHDSRCTCVD